LIAERRLGEKKSATAPKLKVPVAELTGVYAESDLIQFLTTIDDRSKCIL